MGRLGVYNPDTNTMRGAFVALKTNLTKSNFVIQFDSVLFEIGGRFHADGGFFRPKVTGLYLIVVSHTNAETRAAKRKMELQVRGSTEYIHYSAPTQRYVVPHSDSGSTTFVQAIRVESGHSIYLRFKSPWTSEEPFGVSTSTPLVFAGIRLDYF